MGLLDKLQNSGGSPYSVYNGGTPATLGQSSPLSQLHKEYSINGNTATFTYVGYPAPSQLDLNGQQPWNSYDNPFPTNPNGSPPEGIGRF